MIAHQYDYVAALDLGSNSFHMIVVKVDETGTISAVDTIRESVRLGGGMDKQGNIKKSVMKNALECLKRFSQRIHKFPKGAVRIVGTNTLRRAKNSKKFVSEAEKILDNPIEIISGQEEARLIYLGVAHGHAAPKSTRLVVDIGGGSTEFIIGEGMESKSRESLQIGCVSLTLRFFNDGIITTALMEKAMIEAKLIIYPIASAFNRQHWHNVTGCSGTIKAIRNIIHAQGWDSQGISLASLHKLKQHIITVGRAEDLELSGLVEDRKAILPAGLAILIGIFETLEIENMRVSEQSLREGLIYDIIGRIQHTDARASTVKSLANRWAVDQAQADRVGQASKQLFDFAQEKWKLSEEHQEMLMWAASLHEIGLSISHNSHQKHGSYILYNADMPGFSRPEQATLAALVSCHRRKFNEGEFKNLPSKIKIKAIRLGILLRIAVLLHRGRAIEQVDQFKFKVKGKKLSLRFPKLWLDQHSLSYFDLMREKKFLRKIDFELKVGVLQQNSKNIIEE